MRFTTSSVDPRKPENLFGSAEFIARTRNTSLPVPKRFEPTVKNEGDVVI